MRKTFKKPKEFKDDSDGCKNSWAEVRRLHLEQDKLNDERKACKAILSNREGRALKCGVAKKEKERDTADKIFENLLKIETGKPFGITKIGARIMSTITVGDHEVARNLSEPSNQTLMHIDVYADYMNTISPQTPSRALRALLTRHGAKSIE